MTDEEYVNLRRQEIVIIARKIIKKEINIIDGCIDIRVLWFKADLPEDDSYYFFVAIDSDSDTFLRGHAREIASAEYLKEQDKEEEEFLEFYGERIDEECKILTEKYAGMPNLDLHEAFYLIEKNKENAYMSDPKTEEQIKYLEEILNLSLPPSYKMFLKKYGRGGLEGTDFLGIDNKAVEESESAIETLKNRQYGLPSQYIIITKDGDGSYCAIDCSQKNAEGESPVVTWASFFKPAKIAEDFGEFMLAELKNMLEDD